MFNCLSCGQIYDYASEAADCAVYDANEKYENEKELRRSEDAGELAQDDELAPLPVLLGLRITYNNGQTIYTGFAEETKYRTAAFLREWVIPVYFRVPLIKGLPLVTKAEIVRASVMPF